MKSTPILLVVLLLATLQLGGCASIAATFVKPPEDGNLIYAGTRGRFKQLTFQEDTDNYGGAALLLAWPIVAIDFLLCIPTDTLFLPYTIPSSMKTKESPNKPLEPTR